MPCDCRRDPEADNAVGIYSWHDCMGPACLPSGKLAAQLCRLLMVLLYNQVHIQQLGDPTGIPAAAKISQGWFLASTQILLALLLP